MDAPNPVVCFSFDISWYPAAARGIVSSQPNFDFSRFKIQPRNVVSVFPVGSIVARSSRYSRMGTIVRYPTPMLMPMQAKLELAFDALQHRRILMFAEPVAGVMDESDAEID